MAVGAGPALAAGTPVIVQYKLYKSTETLVTKLAEQTHVYSQASPKDGPCEFRVCAGLCMCAAVCAWLRVWGAWCHPGVCGGGFIHELRRAASGGAAARAGVWGRRHALL